MLNRLVVNLGEAAHENAQKDTDNFRHGMANWLNTHLIPNEGP
jgi:hypothetical protein